MSVNFEKQGNAELSASAGRLTITNELRAAQSKANLLRVGSLLDAIPHATYTGRGKDDAMRADVRAEVATSSAEEYARLQRHLLWNKGDYVSKNPLPWVVIGSRQSDKKTELLLSTLASGEDSKFEFGIGIGGEMTWFRHYLPSTFGPRLQICKVDSAEWEMFQVSADAREAAIHDQHVGRETPELITGYNPGAVSLVRNIFHRSVSAETMASADSLNLKGTFSQLYPEESALDDATMLAFNVQPHLDYLAEQFAS